MSLQKAEMPSTWRMAVRWPLTAANSTQNDGFAVSIEGNELSISNSRFLDDVGGLRYSGQSGTAIGCLFAGNVFSVGGGGLLAVIQCTVANNEYGLRLSGGPNAFERCIVCFNMGPCAECFGAHGISISCCNIYGNEAGDYVGCIESFAGIAGNLSLDPLFCDASARDYRLTEASPCHPDSGSCGEIGAFGMGCD